MAEKHILSLQRGMKILEEVAARPEGAGLQDLAAAIECSAPAALNLAKTLVALGYLRRQEKPVRYFLGAKLNELWRLQSSRDYSRQIKQAMIDLAKQFSSMSLYHCVFKGSEIVITGQLDAGASHIVREGADYVLPPYTSVASMVHLAFWPDSLRRQYMDQHPFDTYGIAYWKSEEKFEATLERIRIDGLFHAKLEETTVVSLGVPVLTAGKSLRSSMTISWRPAQTDGIDFDEKRQEIAEAAMSLFSVVNPDLLPA